MACRVVAGVGASKGQAKCGCEVQGGAGVAEQSKGGGPMGPALGDRGAYILLGRSSRSTGPGWQFKSTLGFIHCSPVQMVTPMSVAASYPSLCEAESSVGAAN